MSVVDARMRRAFSRLSSGGMPVYRPEVTTGQVARAGMMQVAMDRLGASGARYFADDMFEIWYKASDGDLPEAATPAWTKYEADSPTAVVASGVLTVTVP